MAIITDWTQDAENEIAEHLRAALPMFARLTSRHLHVRGVWLERAMLPDNRLQVTERHEGRETPMIPVIKQPSFGGTCRNEAMRINYLRMEFMPMETAENFGCVQWEAK